MLVKNNTIKEKGKTEGAVIELCRYMVEVARSTTPEKRNIFAERMARPKQGGHL